MPIEKKDVLQTAKLSKLEISEEEIEGLTKDMTNLVHFVEKINAVNTDNVEPLSSVLDRFNVFREDSPEPSLSVEKTESLSPKFESGYIVVPAVIE